MDVQGRDTLTQQIHFLALTKYGRLGASSRMRTWQYLPLLEQAGIRVTVQTLLSDKQLQARYQEGNYSVSDLIRAYGQRLLAMQGRRRFDLVWIEKEALPWMPLWLERGMLSGIPYVLDYDDAIFHNYDTHRNLLVRHVYGKRLDGLMAGAALVIGGNSYLAQRAKDAGATWVEVLPTVIDLARYPYPFDSMERERIISSEAAGAVPRIVWIGSPSTARYLQLIHEPLQKLAARRPFTLRVIGGGTVELPGVQVEVLPWSEASEVAAISACDIGVMPLLDSPWERGKCGYKLIQYMACGLPVVAADVGVNSEIVKPGMNGCLARSTEEWLDALTMLLDDAPLRARWGLAARHSVEQSYCIKRTAPKLVQWLRSVAIGDTNAKERPPA